MYGFTVAVKGSFDEAVARVTEELKKEGFGVLIEIDVAATLKAKIGVDKRPYKKCRDLFDRIRRADRRKALELTWAFTKETM